MGRKPNIKSPLDFLVAQSQTETQIAKEILEAIRVKGASNSSANEYYEEKLALKMLDFFVEEEKLIAIYAEAKTSYPILAELMENKRPYLKQLLEESKKLYEKSILEK